MNQTPKILMVDDEAWNCKVLEAHLAGRGYHVVSVSSGEAALARMAQEPVDLVVLDIMMPGMNGFEVCRRMKADKTLQSIPVIMATALQELSHKVEGLDAGAADFLSKPFDKAELTARIRAQLRIKSLIDEIDAWNRTLEEKVKQRTRELETKNVQLDESYYVTLEALILALDAREHETGKHSLRVAFYTTELAMMLGIRGRELEEVAMGAMLHDIGKIGISDRVLLKPAKLDEAEWDEMKKHPAMGWHMVQNIEFIGRGREVILAHQEKFDGSGYPNSLKGEAIYMGARCFALADVFDALMSERPYKKAFSFEVSCQIIRDGVGTHFDPAVAEKFLSVSQAHWATITQIVEEKDFKFLIRHIRNGRSALD